MMKTIALLSTLLLLSISGCATDPVEVSTTAQEAVLYPCEKVCTATSACDTACTDELGDAMTCLDAGVCALPRNPRTGVVIEIRSTATVTK